MHFQHALKFQMIESVKNLSIRDMFKLSSHVSVAK